MADLSFVYLIAIIIFTGCSQILLKIGANKARDVFRLFINPYTFIAYVLYLLVTILTVYALRTTALNMFYAITSAKFIIVVILSRVVIGENLNKRKVVAVILIVIGVIIFSM